MQYQTTSLLIFCILSAAACLKGVKCIDGENKERADNLIETIPARSRNKREEVIDTDAAAEVGESKLLCEVSMGNNLCTRLATGCYCIINTQLSWNQAMQYCRKNGLGTSLLSINSLAKQLDLEINLPRLVGQSSIINKVGLWTSGTWLPTIGIFVWASGLQPFSFSQYWMTGYPNNQGGNDCVRIIPSANSVWADLDCYQYLPFVCESAIV